VSKLRIRELLDFRISSPVSSDQICYRYSVNGHTISQTLYNGSARQVCVTYAKPSEIDVLQAGTGHVGIVYCCTREIHIVKCCARKADIREYRPGHIRIRGLYPLLGPLQLDRLFRIHLQPVIGEMPFLSTQKRGIVSTRSLPAAQELQTIRCIADGTRERDYAATSY
jgi:hypothetical protein